MKKLTTRELNTLISIVQDELKVQNNKKISTKGFEKEIEQIVKSQTDHLMKPYEKIQDKIASLAEEQKEMEETIRKAFDLNYHYGTIDASNFYEIKQEARKAVNKKYKLIEIPDKFAIEKMIYKSSSTDFQELIKSIVTQISKQNEYIEVQE